MTKVTSWNGNPILKWLLAIHGLIIQTPNQKKIFGPPRATPKKIPPLPSRMSMDVWRDSFLLHEIVGTWGPRKLAANSLCETAETAVHLVGTAKGVFFGGVDFDGFWVFQFWEILYQASPASAGKSCYQNASGSCTNSSWFPTAFHQLIHQTTFDSFWACTLLPNSM